MNDKRSHVRAWLSKAESDLLAARRLLAADGVTQDKLVFVFNFFDELRRIAPPLT